MRVIGKFEIVKQIGVGGFGIVYEGRDPVLKRRVAIKTCTSADEGLKRRFQREAEIAASLQHVNITTVHDLGTHEGVPYLVQEYLDGEDLDRLIARGEPLATDTKLEYLVQIAEGLNYAHSRGIVHRDIKPSNIRLLADGVLKIMDFGIAKLMTMETKLTRTGTVLGTAAYMSPEQIDGKEIDHRCDIFSFGVVAYELLTYQRPFSGSSISTLMYQILHEDPTPLSEIWPVSSPALDDLIRGCLEKKSSNRPESLADVAARLRDMKTSDPHPQPDTTPETTASAEVSGPTVLFEKAAASPRIGVSRLLLTVALGIVLAVAAWAVWRASRSGAPVPRMASIAVEESLRPTTPSESSHSGEASTTAEPEVELAPPTEANEGSARSATAEDPALSSAGSAARAPSNRDTSAASPIAARPAPDSDAEPPPVRSDRTRAASPRPTEPALERGSVPANGGAAEPTASDPPSDRDGERPPVLEPAPAKRENGAARPAASERENGSRSADTIIPGSDPSSPAPRQEDTGVAAIDETAAIMQALERYEQAHEELDAQALFTVWPSLMSAQRRVFERSFNGYQSMELSIDGCDIAVDGTTAVATCQVIRDVNPKVGRRQNDRRETAFRLRKQDGRWFIDGL